jgi:catechol 2,3-dioxygenase-like lactoylglutathione lyase family enzyme
MTGQDFRYARFHHVLVAMPPGQEAAARAFYGDVLGMTEVAKPPILAERGGVWFRTDGVELHVGVEEDFRAARKAHPALWVENLDALGRRLDQAGIPHRRDTNFPGVRRFYADDPFGNRLEFLEPYGAEAA